MNPWEITNDMILPMTMRRQMARYGHFNLRDLAHGGASQPLEIVA